jgi:branched-chain amino acid transport system permease protein
METIINTIVSGLISGSLYAAMALGLTIVYGVSRVFNFGHGVIAIIGAYVTWLMLDAAGIGLVPAVLISMGFMFLFGMGMYQFAINPLLKKPNWEVSTVLFMLGAGILLENVVLQIFGPRVKSIPLFVEGRLRLGFVKINWHDLILMGIVVVAVILLSLFFKYTRMGQAMRAVAQSIQIGRAHV